MTDASDFEASLAARKAELLVAKPSASQVQFEERIMNTPLTEMTKLKDWAQGRLREGGEPPWSLYCMTQLIEAVDVLSSGAEAGFFDPSTGYEKRMTRKGATER